MKKIVLLALVLLVVMPVMAANPPGQRTVTATWTSPCNSCTFRLYRGLTSGNENWAAPVCTSAVGVLTCVDTSVVQGTSYTYCVTAVNTGGTESACSAEATATTPTAPPVPGAPILVAN